MSGGVFGTHTRFRPLSSPTCLQGARKDWFLAGSASVTICLDLGPETQSDRSVEKAASPMGTGDHRETSSCDIAEATPKPPMPDVARVVRYLARILVGHRSLVQCPLSYTSLQRKPPAQRTILGGDNQGAPPPQLVIPAEPPFYVVLGSQPPDGSAVPVTPTRTPLGLHNFTCLSHRQP